MSAIKKSNFREKGAFGCLLLLSLGIICCGLTQAQRKLYSLTGNSPGNYFGRSVRGAGDVNGDGFADFIVGAPWANPYSRTNAGCATVYSGIDGAVLHVFNGDNMRDELGYSVSGAGDVNKDGFADLIVGAPLASSAMGLARVFSGKDGRILYSFTGNSNGDYFGWQVSQAGDVNNDGYADVVIGSPMDFGTASKSGSISVYSGKTGLRLYYFLGSGTNSQLGYSVAGAGDVNNDGYADIIGGAPLFITSFGQARVYSGKTGTILYTLTGGSSDYQGWSVDGLGDVNKDGFDDVVVGAPWDARGGTRAGTAIVFSGKTGMIIYTLTGLTTFDEQGFSVSGIGDVNRDGHPDILAGAPIARPAGTNSGRVNLYSGKTGILLYTCPGTALNDFFGWSVSGTGDLNGDGVPDLIVGTKLSNFAKVLSGTNLGLTTNKSSLSITFGGNQKLSITAGAAKGRMHYIILGTMTGIKPGITLGPNLHLPLNVDQYFWLTGFPNMIMPNSVGRLNALGKASINYTLPANVLPSFMAGVAFHHAYVLVDGATNSLDSFSNAAPLLLKL